MAEQVRACLVPGMGIRPAVDPGLVAPTPVAVERDGAAMTVTHLYSGGGQTVLRAEFVGLPDTPDADVPRLARSMRVAVGGGDPRGWGMFSGGRGPDGVRFHTESRHAALDAASRSVEVRVDGPPPLGAWWVTVPVLPVAEAGLPIARRGRAAVTRQGVRLAVERAAADGERTAVSLTASFGPAVRFVRGLGHAHGTGPGVVLLDDRRREHVRLADAGQRSFDGHRFELLFSGLPPDAMGAQVVVPFVAVAEHDGEASVAVPLAGRAIDEPIAVDAGLEIGPYPFRVTGARIVDLFGRRLLRLDTDPGGWRDDRRLLGADRVLLDGRDLGFNTQPDDEDGHWSWVGLALPPEPPERVVVTFRYPLVALAGPWRLRLPASLWRERTA